jgi:hypothetical protein
MREGTERMTELTRFGTRMGRVQVGSCFQGHGTSTLVYSGPPCYIGFDSHPAN